MRLLMSAPIVFGAENVHASPSRPEPYPYSFFILDGHQSSPVILLGPVQGDSVDHTLFWLPVESTIICGDTIYARSTHLWVEEIETPQILSAWRHVLDLIESLKPKKMIPGHLEAGWTLDAAADLAHNRKYLNLFSSKITHASEKPKVDDLYQTFEAAFCKMTETGISSLDTWPTITAWMEGSVRICTSSTTLVRRQKRC